MFIRFVRDYYLNANKMFSAGEVVNLDQQLSARFINEGAAVDMRNQARMLEYPFIALGATTIPMIMPPGDGAANGLTWSGTVGAFTITGAVVFQSYSFPQECFLYMPANAITGTGNAAGFYYAILTSTTAGTLYNNLYQGGWPQASIPAAPTPFSGITNATFITQTTGAEITMISLTVPGGVMGPHGVFYEKDQVSCSNNANVKTLRRRGAGNQFALSTLTSTPGYLAGTSIRNRNSVSKQSGANGQSGDYGTPGSHNFYSWDTNANWTFALTLQSAAATDILAVEALEAFVVPGY